AATAALGFAGYVLVFMARPESNGRLAIALAAVAVLVLLVLSGLRRSNLANIIIVSVTLASLMFFVLAGAPSALRNGAEHFQPFFGEGEAGRSPLGRLLEAAALMFVAYTGYGRIATM